LGGNAIPLGGNYNFFKREIQTSLGEIQEHLEFPPRKSNFPLGKIPANFEFVRRREKGHAAKRKHEKKKIG